MSEEEKPTIAILLSIIGGILILILGIIILAVGAAFMGFMMPLWLSSLISGIGIWGIICGLVVLIASYLCYVKPAPYTMWGILILVFSILSFIEGGGFFIGAILGIIGGIWILMWKPAVPVQQAPPS